MPNSTTLTVAKRPVGRPKGVTKTNITARRHEIGMMLVKGWDYERIAADFMKRGLPTSFDQIKRDAMAIAGVWKDELKPEDKEKWILQFTKELQEIGVKLQDHAFYVGKDGQQEIDYRALDRLLKVKQQMGVILGVTRGEMEGAHVGNIITLIEINRSGRQDDRPHPQIIPGEFRESHLELARGTTTDLGQ